MIAGPDLERGIRQAMAREDIGSISEMAARSRIRRDTLYNWFRKERVSVSAASVDKLVATLGARPGDPWYEEPIERTLDPETLALLDRAMDRALERFADRLFAFLDERLDTAPRDDA